MLYKKIINITLSLLFFVNVAHASSMPLIDTDQSKEATTYYQIVLDAGKNKTRLYLYQYSQEALIPSNIYLLVEKKHYPGVADVAIVELSDYLDRLFTPELGLKLQTIMAEHNPSSLSHIQFYSTDGMRLLSSKERQSKNTFIKLWLTHWVKTYNLKIEPELIESRTLSGAEVGAYIWVATNYSEHHFHGPLTGIAKLGAMSSQITYHDPNLTNVNVTVGNIQYPLTSKDYPLGQELIAEKMSNINACQLRGYTPNATGDYFKCKAQLKTLLNSLNCTTAPNATDVNHYSLLANFYYTAQFFGIVQNYSLDALETHAEAFCNLNWETAKTKFQEVNDKYLASYCLGAAYQSTLLSDNFRLSDPQQLNPVNEFNHKEITWPMGVVLTKQYQELY